MVLDIACIRGILLTLESVCDFDTPWNYEEDTFESEYLAEYSHREIIYHIRQCEQSGLIQGVYYYDIGSSITICDLTPLGHEFLANIRTDSIWKKVLSKAAGASLPIVLEIAKVLATQYFLSQ